MFGLHVPSSFGGIAGSEVSTSHLSSRDVLAVAALVGGRARDGGTRAIARCELGLLLGSAAATALLGGKTRAQGARVGALRLLGFSCV